MEGNDVVLARIDERTKNTDRAISDIKDDVKSIRTDLSSLYVTKTEFTPVKEDYVSKKDFEPVRKIVYGVVGIILFAVIGALVALVVKNIKQ
jgi:hypothetical protein